MFVTVAKNLAPPHFSLLFVALALLGAFVLRRHKRSNLAFLEPRLRNRLHPLFIGLTVFCLEFVLMLIIHPHLKDMSTLSTSILEAGMLLLFITPALYYFQVLPLIEVVGEKQHIEKSLLESETFFKTTFYDAPIGAAIVGLDGIITDVNAKLAQFLGYDTQELLGKEFSDLVHPECRERCQQRIAELVSGECLEYTRDKQFITRGKDVSWGSLSVKLVADSSGAPQYLLPMIEDINARKNMEQELTIAWEDWEETFAHIPDGIVILNSDFEVVKANTAFKKLVNQEDQAGKRFYDVLHCTKRDSCKHYSMFRQCIFEDGNLPYYPYTYECYNDILGRFLELTVNTYRTAAPFSTAFIFVVRDVTERKRSELAITESEKRYSLLADNVSDVIWTMDLQLNHTYVSPSILAVQGFTPEEMMESSFERSFPPESVEYIKGVLQEQLALEREGKGSPDKYINMETEAYRKDGSRLWLEIRVCFIRDKNNAPTGFLGVSRDVSDRRRKEQRLRLLEKAVNTTRTGITFRDTDNIIRFINPADAAMHGYEPEELLGQHIRLLAPLRFMDNLDRDAMTSLKTWSRESKNLRKDGSEFPVALVSDVVKDETGKTLGVITTCEDITERLEIEKELRKLSRAIEQSPVSVVITDPKGTIEYVNPAFSLNTGYSFEEAVGKNPRILKSGWQTAEVYKDLWSTITSGKIWRGELSNKNRAGDIFWENVVIAPIKDQEGKVTNFIAVKENITEQKKAKEALLNREARLRSIMDGVTDSLITVDEQGIIESCNPATATIFGYQIEELVGEKVLTLLPKPYHRRVTKFFENQTSKRPVQIGRTLTLRGLRKDGSTFPLSMSLGIAKLAEQTLFAATIRDISEIKQNQRALLEAKANAESANAAKSDFLARMSHEIRTPMNAIIGMSNLVKMTSLDAQQVHYVNNIFSASKSLLRIINDILDFSKIEAGHLVLESIKFRLDDLFNNLKNVVGLTAYDKGIDLIFDLDDSIPEVLIGDPLRIEQVLTNLVNNAVKFTHEGEVIIKASAQALSTDKAVVRFSVTDTGIGLDPEQIESLFLPFTQADGSITRQFGGTGLGLTICKRLVELMGGRLWVTSEKGKGSTFTFELELPYTAIICGAGSDFNGLAAMVIDPNPESRHMLVHCLETANMRVVSAEDINTGYETFLSAAAGRGVSPDILIVDTTATDFTVEQVYDWLASHPAVKTIFICGLAIPPELKENRNICTSYLTKPVIKSQLLETVQRVIQVPASCEKPRIGQSEKMNTDEILGGKRVLLAEDNAINQLYAVKILEKKGLEVDTVKNGKEAIEAVRRNTYDIVLMDMEMPVMDGLKATAMIRSIRGCDNLPIVAMTAHAMGEHKQLALNSGMNDYISKPIELQNLHDVLVKWLIPQTESPIADTADSTNQSRRDTHQFPGIDFEDGLARLAGDRKLYLQVLAFFHETYSKETGTLATLIQQGSKKDAHAFVHSIIGAAGNIGAQGLFEAGKNIESVLAECSCELAAELIERFESELARVLRGLASLTPETEEI